MVLCINVFIYTFISEEYLKSCQTSIMKFIAQILKSNTLAISEIFCQMKIILLF